MGGPRLLLESTLQHEPKLGRTEWTPVSVTLRLPEDAVSVKAGFLHQANGTMAVRNPVLRIVEDGCAAAAPSSP
jgi:hypothetical protein